MPPSALLIVHGVGMQRPQQTVDTFVEAFRQAHGPRLEVGAGPGGRSTAMRLGDHEVLLYEVHWADLADRQGQAVQNGGWTVEPFSWHTLMATAWQPIIGHRLGLLHAVDCSGLRLWFRSLAVLVALPGARLFYEGAALLLGLGQRLSSMLVRFKQRSARRRERWTLQAMVQQVWAAAEEGRASHAAADRLLDGFVADVFNYMQSVSTSGPMAAAVRDRFDEQRRAATADGCADIHVLAHSLGSVIAYQVLSNAAPSGVVGIRTLYTIGSPLAKVVYFWPWTMAQTAPSFEWLNFHHVADGIAGPLAGSRRWSSVKDIALWAGGGPIRSHGAYARSTTVMRHLSERLLNSTDIAVAGWGQRTLDMLISAVEAVALPVLIGAGIAWGLLGLAVVVALIPALVWWMLGSVGLTTVALATALPVAGLNAGSLAFMLWCWYRKGYRAAAIEITARYNSAGRPEPARA